MKHQTPALLPDFARFLIDSNRGDFFHANKYALSPTQERVPVPVLQWDVLPSPGGFLPGIIRRVSSADFARLSDGFVDQIISVPHFSKPVHLLTSRPLQDAAFSLAATAYAGEERYFDPDSHSQLFYIQINRHDFSEFGDDFLQVSDQFSLIPPVGISTVAVPCRTSLTELKLQHPKRYFADD
jgi:hypothetical protein